jgi:hypothetical protein
MVSRIIFGLFFLLSGFVVRASHESQSFDKEAYYAVMASGNLDRINTTLNLLSSTSIPEKEAFQGALLMRKAGLLSIPAEKLKFFKSGRIKLESSLLKDSTNGEYRFLRLIIQEHAPKIVRYNMDLEKDSRYLRQIFKTLSPVVQQAIINYSKNSKILRPEDFRQRDL